LALTDRAGRWVTVQVGCNGRAVNDVILELCCDWHTVIDAKIAYGTEYEEQYRPTNPPTTDAIGDVLAIE
jgi:hypothetical protein